VSFYSIGRLCNKVEACEARIEISVLRSESTDLKLGKIIGLMESPSRDISSLRERQNMILRNQDQLQSILSGEVKWPYCDTPTSMSTPSIMTHGVVLTFNFQCYYLPTPSVVFTSLNHSGISTGCHVYN
jgi:hypothetical protein